MKHFIFLCLIAFANILYAQNKEYYEASIEVNYFKMPLTIEYSLLSNDSLSLLLGSPSQTEDLLQADKAYIKEDSLLFRLKKFNITCRAKYSTNKDSIIGTFKQGNFKTEIVWLRTNQHFSYNRPQTPVPPFRYIVEDFEFTNPKVKNYTFKGTLTRPKRGNNFPCVILISGSGIQDRDCTLLGHKMFMIIADYLTNSGMAVLRFDDRGYGTNDTALLNATTLDYVSDVESAIEALKHINYIDPKHIGLLGHSEGGLIAQIIASKDTSLNFIILMASPGISGREVLVSQLKALTKAKGITNEKEIEAQLVLQKNAIENKKASKWIKTFVDLNPKNYLPYITQPTLILQGAKDLQVTPQENLSAIREYFGRAVNNFSYKVLVFSDNNHLFQRCKTGLPSEYGEIDLTIDTDVLHYLVTFIREKNRIKKR
ncbi:MAG: alpha/beta hydrolase [Bacteroidales bacterium]|jgi:pimeloyl-ACP methyl ester carboxylesterase|nr:alpha/beta hydrolase [Bacteroidales bacterium]